MTHDDTTLQAAIDAAFQTNGEKYDGYLVTLSDHYAWSREDSARLAVAKAFLAALPPAEQSAEIEKLKAEVEPAQPWQPAVGDVVRLKSGGPQVTVKGLTSDGLVSCIWFTANGQYHQFQVPAACLELVRKEMP
jgi:uncharacterized protein YodC (DUF2158 family)